MKTLYLVTGVAGFLGTNVCAQLLARGNAVRAFVLHGDPAAKFIQKEVEVFEGDLCSAEDCETFFNVDADTETVCIHCASMVTINPNYNEKLIAVNVGGTEHNLERNNQFDCTKAKNELGFAPRPYKETLHDLAAWLKQEGKIA